MQAYKVSVQVSETREFVVDANSPEEAESIAEQWYEEGEEGNLVSIDDLQSEALPEEAAD